MKQIIRLFLLFTAFFCFNYKIYATESEVVTLDSVTLPTLKVTDKPFKEVNQNTKKHHHYNNDYKYSNLEDEVFDSKAGKFFSNFIEDKIINNKLNKFLED